MEIKKRSSAARACRSWRAATTTPVSVHDCTARDDFRCHAPAADCVPCTTLTLTDSTEQRQQQSAVGAEALLDTPHRLCLLGWRGAHWPASETVPRAAHATPPARSRSRSQSCSGHPPRHGSNSDLGRAFDVRSDRFSARRELEIITLNILNAPIVQVICALRQ